MTPLRKILITGFEPFAEAKSNPSGEIARALDHESIAGCAVVGRILPAEFGGAGRQLIDMIQTLEPTLVLCLGLAASRRTISLERVAVNLDDARISDNAGQQPIDQPVIDAAPTAYLTTLPIEAMLGGMTSAGYPTELSSSAGNFVCNHLFFALMHELDQRSDMRGGFIHVPALSERLSHEQLVAGVALGAKIAMETSVDVVTPGGRID